MSAKNFVSYGDAETLFTGVGNKVKAKADLTDLAPAFSTSSAYTVGQYVSYNGNIYKCTYAHSAGAWVAGDFTLVAVGSELNTINSKLAGLEAYDGFAGQSICYFESNNPNVEIYITGAGTSIESALGSEDASKNLYMIRFTADAPATLTARLFEYDEEYPVMIMNPDLPITYFDGTPFTRAIHAGDYIIIKLTYGPSSLTGGVIVADFDSTLTGLRSDVKLNTQDLTTSSRTKNLLPMTVDGIKTANTDGTWNGNAYTISGVTFTLLTDDHNNVIGIETNGTSTNDWVRLVLNANFALPAGSYAGNGITGGNNSTYRIDMNCFDNSITDGDILTTIPDMSSIYAEIVVRTTGTNVSGKTFYPMIRLATEIDAIFAPYIPSAESRIEDLESDVNVINSNIASKAPIDTSMVCLPIGTTSDGQHYSIDLTDYVTSSNRYACFITISNQSGTGRIVPCAIDNGLVSVTDTDVTFDVTTKILSVDAGSSAWCFPILVIPYSAF